MKSAPAPRRPEPPLSSRGRRSCRRAEGSAISRRAVPPSSSLLLPLVAKTSPPPPTSPRPRPSSTTPSRPIIAGETPVSFNAVGSRDSDGTIASYNWSFGDGTPEQSTTSPTIVHVFADTPARCIDVTYAVLLTVVDDKGDSGSASQQVKVTELPVAGSAQCR